MRRTSGLPIVYAVNVSIHAPWEGCDNAFFSSLIDNQKFQFTHPGKGATTLVNDDDLQTFVSIHAPWEGCDTLALLIFVVPSCFNSRTLGRVRREFITTRFDPGWFQFTHPGKGATYAPDARAVAHRRFNSRTLGRVRRGRPSGQSPTIAFQFTHPGKGATVTRTQTHIISCVSIHAPWEGCDLSLTLNTLPKVCFNSRTLGRVRLILTLELSGGEFVSIHAPWEGCDVWVFVFISRNGVSIHAPWEGCDRGALFLSLQR